MSLWYMNSAALHLFLHDMKVLLSFTVFLFCAPVQLKAQLNSPYNLSVFGTRDGLLSSKIYTLIQSSDNCLWIGTENGASRYNGYEFQNIQYTSSQEQIGKIMAITEDSSGGIWLGGEGGLFYYDDGIITRCDFIQTYVPAIESLVTDNEGTVWLGEMHGLYRLTTAQIKGWNADKKPFQLSKYLGLQQRIMCLDADALGNLYYGTFEGVYFIAKGAPAVRHLWKNTDFSNAVAFITALSPNAVFFNQYNGNSIALLNNTEKVYVAKTNTGHSFFKRESSVFLLTTSTVESFQAGTFKTVFSFEQQTNFAYDGVMDVEGNIWVGTWEGLLKYRYNPFSVYRRKGTSHPETFSMLETREGRLLFGGNRGAVHYKKGSEIVPVIDMKPVFDLSEVLAIYQHSDGSFWFGSGYQGITSLKDGVYTNYNESNGLLDNHCNTFYAVNDHTVFGCTEKGVVVIDPSSETPIKGYYNFDNAYNRHPKLLGMFLIDNGTYLFYSNQGLFRLKNGKLYLEEIKGLPTANLYITGIQKGKEGTIWISTQGKGLLQCRLQQGSLLLVKQFTKKEGLLSDELLSILIDKNGRLWIADYMSLSLLQKEGSNFSFVNFTEGDGLPPSYYQYLNLQEQKNGTIWALNSMNLFSFHPDSIVLNKIAPKLFFTNIGAEKEASQTKATTTETELPYNQNSLSFAFNAVSLSNPQKIKYAYRLLPSDTSWIETVERKLYFSSLSSGSYTIEVKAANNTGLWSAPIIYPFRIKPPFWNTAWARAIFFLGFFGFIYWLFRRRIKSVKDQAALQQQLTELESKALRAQMNPHFIFNSLNAIQELIVTKDVEAAYNYLSKFSKLLRFVLHNSEKAAIPLSDEVAMLRLYLELESLRFRASFCYDIAIDPLMDVDTILVPPLLLQPFIENALWHGLMPKEGSKRLHISITQKEEVITCTVEDNGIGRKKAAEIKSEKIGAQHFESKGLGLSRQRLQLLQKTASADAIEIEDLYEEGVATGTKVIVNIPAINS